MTQTQPQTFRTESRTFTWASPGQADPRVLMALDGIGQLRAMAAGELPPPPIMATLGFTDFRPEPGRVVVEMPVAEFHYNPLGGVHGGVISTLVDSALGCAVHSRLPAGVGYTSLEIKVNFVRPVTLAVGTVRCEGTVLSLGRRAATAEARVTSASGKLLAHATTTCMLFPLGE